MTEYSAQSTAMLRSREELGEIFRWLQGREEGGMGRTTVLIGGWAVYSYNPWYGSVDIDLVTNNRTRQDLMWYLREERGFVPRRDPLKPTTVEKSIPEGLILIDFASREEIYRFEGREEECPFSLLDDNAERREIDPGFSVIVPKRTLLLIFKVKAAWDRSFRIDHGSSIDEEWEKSKLCKDRADILALIDPGFGGTEIDIQYLGRMLHGYPFLSGILRTIPRDPDAIEMYRRMDRDEALDSIDRLLLLTGGATITS